jgi:hypothetical protein
VAGRELPVAAPSTRPLPPRPSRRAAALLFTFSSLFAGALAGTVLLGPTHAIAAEPSPEPDATATAPPDPGGATDPGNTEREAEDLVAVVPAEPSPTALPPDERGGDQGSAPARTTPALSQMTKPDPAPDGTPVVVDQQPGPDPEPEPEPQPTVTPTAPLTVPSAPLISSSVIGSTLDLGAVPAAAPTPAPTATDTPTPDPAPTAPAAPAAPSPAPAPPTPPVVTDVPPPPSDHWAFRPYGAKEVEEFLGQANRIQFTATHTNALEAAAGTVLNEIDRGTAEASLEAGQSMRDGLDLLEHWTVWPTVTQWATGKPFRSTVAGLLGDEQGAAAAEQDPASWPDLSASRAAVDEATARRDEAAGQVGPLLLTGLETAAQTAGAAVAPGLVPTPGPGAKPWQDSFVPPAVSRALAGDHQDGRPMLAGLGFPLSFTGTPAAAPVPVEDPTAGPVSCPVVEGASEAAAAELGANCTLENGRHNVTLKGSLALSPFLTVQARKDLNFEVARVVENGAELYRVTVLEGDGGGVGTGLGGVGLDLGNLRHGFGGRVAADLNGSAQSSTAYDFATKQEALDFQEALEQAALRDLGGDMVTPPLPLADKAVRWLYDHAVPDPLAGYQPRFETSQLWTGLKGKGDAAGWLIEGGLDVAASSVAGMRTDDANGRRTVFLRYGGQAWGGLASLAGLGPNASAITNGDAQLALTLDAQGRPVELSVTLTGAAGAHGNRWLQGGDGGELHGGLRDPGDRIKYFDSALGTLTRAEGGRQQVVARLDLADPANRAALAQALAALSVDSVSGLDPAAAFGTLTGERVPASPAAVAALVERIRQTGKVYSTSSDWDGDILNVEIGNVGRAATGIEGIGSELVYVFDHDRNLGTRVWSWGPRATPVTPVPPVAQVPPPAPPIVEPPVASGPPPAPPVDQPPPVDQLPVADLPPVAEQSPPVAFASPLVAAQPLPVAPVWQPPAVVPVAVAPAPPVQSIARAIPVQQVAGPAAARPTRHRAVERYTIELDDLLWGLALRRLGTGNWTRAQLEAYVRALREHNQAAIDAYLAELRSGAEPSAHGLGDGGLGSARPDLRDLETAPHLTVALPGRPGAVDRVLALDALWGVAARHLPGGIAGAEVERYGRAIWARNPQLGDDPLLLRPGTEIVLPGPPRPA